jgi:hypothetical protein
MGPIWVGGFIFKSIAIIVNLSLMEISVINIVGRRSELRGEGVATLSAKKVVPPLPFKKFAYKVEKQQKISDKW